MNLCELFDLTAMASLWLGYSDTCHPLASRQGKLRLRKKEIKTYKVSQPGTSPLVGCKCWHSHVSGVNVRQVRAIKRFQRV